MKVNVHLYSQSQPVVLEEVVNAYQKGDLYCVLKSDGSVYKFPLIHIFRIKEIGSYEERATLPNMLNRAEVRSE